MNKLGEGAKALLGKCPECQHPYLDHCVTAATIQRWNSKSKLKPRACKKCDCKFYLTASK